MIRAEKQTGYILLPVIVVITLVAAIALLMNTESALESNTTASELDAQQARYVVEAGVNHAMWQLQQQGCGAYTDISNQAIANGSYSTVLTTDLATTTSYTIAVDQDTWIRNDFPGNNHSGDARMHTKYEAGKIENILVRYDLSAIPAKAAILSARAWFYVDKKHPEGPIEIHTPTADWLETDATWTSMGDKLDTAIVAMLPAQANDLTWVSANLTAQVQGWVNGQLNYGIALTSSSEKSHGQYASRESANAPYLEVTVGIAPSSPALLKSVGTLSNGIERKILRNDVTLYQAPLLIERRPDASEIDDTYIWASNKTTNYGADDESWASTGSTNESLSLYRFDLSNLKLPPQAKIVGATLSLYHRSGNDADVPITAQRITSDWKEDEVTWNKRDNGNNWDNPGGDYDADVISTTLVGSTGPGSTKPLRYEWDIGRLLLGWLDGSYPNYGVVLRTEEPGTFGEQFDTSDHTDPLRHPRLMIDYTLPCGQASIPPQGAGRIVMIGNDVGIDPDPRDEEKEDIIESWGYDVDIFDDNFIWAIDFNNYDLVYISETASSAAIIGQLNWRSIGIVNEQGNSNFDLGFATTKATLVGDAVDIVDNSHYITAPFPLGPLPIYAAQMELITAAGSKASGMQTLAEAGAVESLMLLDAGATGVNGPVPGKRVALPLGRATNSDFNWNYLNNNGRLLVQRAIEWGIGKKTIAGTSSLLLVVVNPSSLTPQEAAKQSLFESWGYSVNLIDESDNQTDFDAALVANNVVYITEDVNSGNVNTKLVNAAIGVVTEEDNLSNEFGMAASIAWESGTQVEINDNSHYITSPFSLGLLPILTANESLAYVTGTQSPDLGQLASSTSGYGVVTLEAGAAMYGGGSATGRRAQLPWGGNDFDVNHLNDDGLTILRRALEWGTGVDAPGPVAHWKLDETGGFTAVDSEGGNDGTLTSGPDWTPALFLGGLDFDGSNDYVDAGTFDVSGSGITMMGWFNAEAITTDDGRIVSKANGPNAGDAWWQLSTTDSGANRYLRMRIKAGGTTTTFADSSVNLVTDRWYFAVGTYDSASGDMKLYLDGVEVASGSHAVGGALDTDPSVPVAIGANGTAERFFNGLLDDVRVYDYALSSGEIEELAQLPGPIAHWKLDELGGPTAVDSEGGHDGTWTNGPAASTGVIDGGLVFDGSNDHIVVPHDDNLSLTNFSINAWVKPSALSGWQIIVNKGTTTSAVNYYLATNGDEVGFGFYNAGWVEFNTASADLNTDQWYHVVATYDDTSRDGRIYLNGGVIHTSTASKSPLPNSDNLTIGRSGFGEYWDGTLDDIRIYDRVLTDSEVSDLYDEGGIAGSASYTEMYQQWSATSDDTWQNVDLSVYGVPANAVVEVAVTNNTNNRRWGGVRAVGSSLNRRFRLHKAEGGGLDVVTMHVQTNASSQIQHYSDRKAEVKFTLLGYWVGANYVELFDPFTANASNTWVEEDVSDDNLGPNQVAEIVMLNSNQSAERLAGVRASGSSYQRRFNLHEAESGGIDAYSMMATTDASSILEVFAQSATDIEFVVLGYWSTPPGTYVENGVGPWTASSTSWETIDLSGIGVPGGAVVQVTIGNLNPTNERLMGVRAVGSGLNRRLDLHKAEAGGSERATWHVNADASSNIQSYAEASGAASRFAPVGWWVLSP